MADQHKAEMSIHKLSLLIVLISSIWILCYNAQKQFPSRHIVQAYERLGDRKVSEQSLKYAINVANGANDTQIHLAKVLQKYGLNKQLQSQICVIVAHKEGQTNWMKALKSILVQDYSKYKVVYLNNYKGGQEIYKFLEQNMIDKEKVKVVDDSLAFSYITHFEAGRMYCNKESIVIFLCDAQRFNGVNVFTILNSFFVKDENLKLLYTSALVQVPKSDKQQLTSSKDDQELSKNEYTLSRTYQYPQKILKQGTFKNYPYLVNGLTAVRENILQQVTKQSLIDSRGELYKQASQVAIGFNLLKNAKQNIKYIPQPLLIKKSQTQFITLNEELKGEIKDIANKP